MALLLGQEALIAREGGVLLLIVLVGTGAVVDTSWPLRSSAINHTSHVTPRTGVVEESLELRVRKGDGRVQVRVRTNHVILGNKVLKSRDSSRKVVGVNQC